MSAYTPEVVRDKLRKLTETQESIQTLSHWVIYHRKRHAQSVEIWKSEIDEVEPQRKLLYLYLANDILQESRRRGNEFIEEFTTVMTDVILSAWRVSPELIQKKVMRLLDIWETRHVFPSSFIQNIIEKLKNPKETIRQKEKTPSPPPPLDEDNPVEEDYIPSTSTPPLDDAVPPSPTSDTHSPPPTSDDFSDLDPDTVQSKFSLYLPPHPNIKIIERTVDLLNQSLVAFPRLSEIEATVQEIAPYCLQFTPVQVEEIRKGDLASLHSYKTQIQLNETVLQDYKSQLDTDLSLSNELHTLLTSLFEWQCARIKRQEEGVKLVEKVINSTKMMEQKLDQRIGQAQEDGARMGLTPMAVYKESYAEGLQVGKRFWGGDGGESGGEDGGASVSAINFEEYKRRKLETNTQGRINNENIYRENKEVM